MGSGAAQTALGLCMMVFGRPGQNPKIYQDFKEKFIAGLENSELAIGVTLDITSFVRLHKLNI